jgi:hypothetical protein
LLPEHTDGKHIESQRQLVDDGGGIGVVSRVGGVGGGIGEELFCAAIGGPT